MAEVAESVSLRKFTLDEYHRMGEVGVFGPEERVELIRGAIHVMSPKGKRHSYAVARANRLFTARLIGKASVFAQDAFRQLDWDSEPEPDLLIASNPDPDTYGTDASRTLLVIEVAESSLKYDREVKGPLYAEARVPEYWILNLIDDVLEIYRSPHDGRYQEMRTLHAGESTSPISWPDLKVVVGELIPRRPKKD